MQIIENIIIGVIGGVLWCLINYFMFLRPMEKSMKEDINKRIDESIKEERKRREGLLK